jgi:hypothetical protein
MNKLFKFSIAYTYTVLFLLITYIAGCGGNGTTNPPPTGTGDTNVVIFDALTISQYFNDTSFSAVDLTSGSIIRDASANKDMVMRDSAGTSFNFYLRSGDQTFDIVPGYACYFNSHYASMTKQQFDTLSKIPAGHDTLTLADFPYIDTRQWGYFTQVQNQGRVYEFYLVGKYNAGITPHQVFGVIYLKSGAFNIGVGFQENVAIKINKGGHNKFVK